MTKFVLDKMQVFDQQIALARTAAQKAADIIPSIILQLAAFGRVAPFAFARFPDALLLI
jgi:hypothetical protein